MTYHFMLTPSSQSQIKITATYYLLKYIFYGLLTSLVFTFISFWSKDNYLIFSNKIFFPTIIIGLTIYIFLTLAFTNFTSSILTLLLILCLQLGSYKKQSATGEPLIFGDISHINHLTVAMNYISTTNLIIAGVLSLLLLTYNLTCNLNYIKKKWWRYFGVLISSIFLFFNAHTLVLKAASLVQSYGMTYYSWDWPYNLMENGLAVHLIQTGNRPLPVTISQVQRKEFEHLRSDAAPSNNSPETFIMILCESCWYDDDTFNSTFAPLINKASTSFRGISSEYGGGTPNASFEFITGLPARNPAVAGIVYQEYRDYLSNSNSTLPSHLRENGFRTESIHNYHQSFWFRNIVEPKLGFERFTGIEDMTHKATENDYPSDHVLFDHAISVIKENHGSKKLFMHLATMYTHGPYQPYDNDGGTHHYNEKLIKTVKHIGDFINEVRKIDPNSVVFIYGDHKPGLPQLFHAIDKNKHIRGDVPILLFDTDTERAVKTRIEVNGKPFYCMSATLSRIYFSMTLPSSQYTDKVCESYDEEKYEDLSASIPAWLYSAALFDKKN